MVQQLLFKKHVGVSHELHCRSQNNFDAAVDIILQSFCSVGLQYYFNNNYLLIYICSVQLICLFIIQHIGIILYVSHSVRRGPVKDINFKFS